MRVKLFSMFLLINSITLFGSVDVFCRKELETLFVEGKFLVLKIDGIPTMVQKMPGNLGAKSYCEIKIDTKGEWKTKSFLGEQSDSTNILSRGDILLVTSLDFNKESFEIRTKTDKVMAYNAKGRITILGSTKASGTGIHATRFIFKIDPTWGCEEIKVAIDRYFSVYNTRDEITQAKEIKMGMTIAEVVAVLGDPSKKADMGAGKLVFKYEDTVVTFQDEKVVNIEFK